MFGDDLVEITYQANVTGIENIQALAAANDEAAASQKRYNDWVNSPDVQQYTEKVKSATQAQNQNTDSLVKAGRELNMFRRGMMGLLLPITADILIMNEMAKGSEVIAASMDSAGNAIAGWAGKVGNAIAGAAQILGAMSAGLSYQAAKAQADQEMANTTSIKTRIAELQLEAKTQKDYGDDLAALKAKQTMEQLQLQEKFHGDAYNKLKTYLDRSQAAEMDAYKLSEYGLENHMKIMQGLQKGLVSGFQGDVGNIIGDVIAGRPQTGAQMIQSFRDTLGKEFGDAISKSLFTALASGQGIGGFFQGIKDFFTGDSAASRAQRKAEQEAKAAADRNENNQKAMLDVLNRIAECTCSAAQSANATFNATITPPKTSTLSKVGSILGAVGSLSSLNFGGGGGAPTPGPAPDFHPTLTMGQGTPNASGGFVGSFPSGGEVPIMAMPGEFVVRRPAAQANKNLLEQINAGGKPQAGSNGSVFVINANDAQSFAALLSSPSARQQMEIQIIRAISNNGSLRDIIKNYAK